MSKTDYEFRSYVLRNYSDYNKILKCSRKYSYFLDKLHENYDFDSECYSMRLSQLEPYALSLEELHTNYEGVFDEFDLINNADKQRRKRLRKKVNSMFLKGQCYFVTLTFNDNTLNSTDYKQRRIMVTRFLKTVCSEYVGNVDYGTKNEREHFHAVILSDKLDDIKYIFTKKYGWICGNCPQFSKWSKNGFYSIKSCGTEETDINKLGAYVSKLTNHAIKETTKRNALIYSR